MTKEELRRQAQKRRQARIKATKAAVVSALVITISLASVLLMKG